MSYLAPNRVTATELSLAAPISSRQRHVSPDDNCMRHKTAQYSTVSYRPVNTLADEFLPRSVIYSIIQRYALETEIINGEDGTESETEDDYGYPERGREWTKNLLGA